MPGTTIEASIATAAGLLARTLRGSLATELEGALARGEMSLHYQPRVALADGRRAGAEALLRWRHPERGNIPPDQFIPLAEGTGQILGLGAWVLREAAREAAGWPAAAGTVSVNVSAAQVNTGALPRQVAAALAESGLPPERLELELTESRCLTDTPETRRMLGTLRDQGIGLALDDFGTGYASLSRLRRLPFSTLKLDRSFIGTLPEGVADAAILRAVRALASALRLRLVAEGVEREAQRDFLARLGCEEAQGWLFGRAVPAEVLRGAWGPAGPLAFPPEMPIPAGACPLPASPSSAPAWPASPLPIA